MIPLLSLEQTTSRLKEIGIEGPKTISVSRLLMQNPPLGGAMWNLLDTLMSHHQIPARTRELIILRTAWCTGCEYVFMRHVLQAQQLDLPEQEIIGVRDPEKCPSYSAVDRAVIAMATDLAHGDNVSSKTWAVLERSFAPAQLLELLATAGNWRMVGVMFKVAKLPLDPEIASGWPEGRRPPV